MAVQKHPKGVFFVRETNLPSKQIIKITKGVKMEEIAEKEEKEETIIRCGCGGVNPAGTTLPKDCMWGCPESMHAGN